MVTLVPFVIVLGVLVAVTLVPFVGAFALLVSLVALRSPNGLVRTVGTASDEISPRERSKLS